MNISVKPYDENDAEAWDAFCAGSLQATLLHTRRFLSYHGNRFLDRSLIIKQDGKWLGLFPAALNPQNESCVVSHPGITYGGVVHRGELRGEQMIAALNAIRYHYSMQSYRELLYKAIPSFYHQAPAQDDLYALSRLGAERTRCDLSSTIDLQHRLPVSQRRRRSFKKAIKAGVQIAAGHQLLGQLWEVLTDNLARKHRTKPVHTYSEMAKLAELFPTSIECIGGRLGQNLVAGVVLFETPTTYHCQYIASSELGHEVSALDLILEHCIAKATQMNKRWFDFGISNESQGQILNQSLYQFKNEFGAGGAVHEFYQLNL
ncbi:MULTISPECIES: GNAT family N-acetyltransferase [Methylomonas]|uniref:Methicillin resistance protein n=1 Tax=Methylomonas koyamae TaxID=702114 RepID=A0A291IIS9_9GAMM|nr:MULTISPECIES: GNAT family N-acetyltransferase [Methylomonas]ANE55261.1 methicillin resistance protein [Methylomonas sp. DH-1]ATG90067.1 methicillin resistance protein [Methylomonas koyamae]OAI23132.1 methicillin resistance protein [Methylomonas koyamae]